MVSPNLFDFPFCFFVVVANQQLHVFKMKQEYKLTIRKFEKIQMDARCVHESLLVEFCSVQHHLHIVVQTVKGKVYFITVKMSESEFKCQQTTVETYSWGSSCLSVRWME